MISGTRILALVRKDLAELLHHPGALVPPFLLLLVAVFPAFIVTLATPAWSGERLDHGDLAATAQEAATALPSLATLSGTAQVQALLFQQFLLMTVTMTVAGSMALAAQSVIGEKQARTLEPLLATPLRTSELLAAKTLTPLLISGSMYVLTLVLYASGIGLFAEPGVLRAIVNAPTLLLVLGAGPLVAMLSLQLAVIVSSRVNDARSAQQLGTLVVLPVTALFVAQLISGFVVGSRLLLLAILLLTLLNLLVLAIGVRVFDRERILLNWK